jgi:uncharacterized membrane-anchored protein YitT (DUF2179 family)
MQWKRLATAAFLTACFITVGFLLAAAGIGLFYLASAATVGFGIVVVLYSRWFEGGELAALNLFFRSKLAGILPNAKRVG